MGKKYEVFESHLGSVLQAMVDFGLVGCGWCEVGDVFLRSGGDTMLEGYGELICRDLLELRTGT